MNIPAATESCADGTRPNCASIPPSIATKQVQLTVNLTGIAIALGENVP
jgi:hypothetical protein